MTDFERFIAQHLSQFTVITMGGDWTNKLEIVRRVNGYSAKAIITAHYYDDRNETIIKIKGV